MEVNGYVVFVYRMERFTRGRSVADMSVAYNPTMLSKPSQA